MENDIIEDEDSLPLEEDEVSAKEANLAILAALGSTLAAYRTDAIAARASSGVEKDWQADEDAYQGLDSVNVGDKDSNPLGDAAAVSNPAKPVRSTVFLNITRPYVDAAAAKVADMLLPTDDVNFDLEPTPVPELERYKTDKTQLLNPDTLNPLQKTQQNANGDSVTSPFTVSDMAVRIEAEADKAVKKAKRRISDWHVECGYSDEFRRVIEDAARLGTGILKGPFPISKRTKVVHRANGMVSIEMVDAIQPASKRIDPRNFYPDPSCGTNIHDGNYVWERDEIIGRKLSELRNDPSYIAANIDLVLAEGPSPSKSNTSKRYTTEASEKEMFEIWYYYGFVSSEDLTAAGCECEEVEYIPAIVVMVNDRVIKAMLAPQETGEFPFDVFVWQTKTDHWTGVGVARQVNTPQRMLNAATRNMLDNAGLSSGPQLVMRRNLITPADGVFDLRPRKIWYASDEMDARSVSDAIAAINIPTMQAELMAIVQFAMKMAEDVTGLPMLLQGQQGKAPDTVGGMTILSNNASTVLRRLARNADSMLIKPHISRYYDWLLEDPDVPDDEKGDASVKARGASALAERDIRNQLLGQAVQLSLNPAFELHPARALQEFLVSQRVDVSRLKFTDAEKRQMQEAQKNAPSDPRVISAQAAIQSAQLRAQTEGQRIQSDSELAAAEMQMRREEAQAEREHRERVALMERDTAILKLASSEKLTIDQIKARLADTALKERNKREMQDAETAVKMRMGSGL